MAQSRRAAHPSTNDNQGCSAARCRTVLLPPQRRQRLPASPDRLPPPGCCCQGKDVCCCARWCSKFVRQTDKQAERLHQPCWIHRCYWLYHCSPLLHRHPARASVRAPAWPRAGRPCGHCRCLSHPRTDLPEAVKQLARPDQLKRWALLQRQAAGGGGGSNAGRPYSVS